MSLDGSHQLCLECGLCCNGVIFATGQLQPEDDAARLQSLGLKLLSARKAGGDRKFKQPCAAFDGCRCDIYNERPKYCRAFECQLLQSVQSGATTSPAALRTIRTARRRAVKVKSLLQQLGDTDESMALSLRFRRTQKRLEREIPSEESAALYGQLTLAVHDLNRLLSEAFYPG